MAISASMVKELRERTGLGMMDCKRALEDANGDMELAISELRKSSALKAAKKAGRTAADGLLGLAVSDDGTRAAMVEVNIETDFAAKNEKFIAFVGEVLAAVMERGSDDIAALLEAGFNDKRETLVQEIGENIQVRRASFITSDAGAISGYLHTDQRRGALVCLSAPADQVGRDVAMHVTASDPVPVVVTGDQMPDEVLAKEREIYEAQAADSGKPADIVAKMVEGRVRKFLAEASLVDQPFVKDPNQKVGQLLKGAGVTCERFERFEVGEGIEREEVDFATEVQAQLESS